MKKMITLALLLCFFAAGAQKTITSVNNVLIPDDLREKLKAIQDPEKLEAFNYEKKFREFEDGGSTATFVKTLQVYFSNGVITGTLTTQKIQLGYETETQTLKLNICYMFCCTTKDTGTEKCTTDFSKFKEYKVSPGCSSSRTTVCN